MTLCALLLTGVAAFCAGCGEDRSNLLPGDTVAEINSNLDQVNELYANDDCIGAISTADEIKTQVLGLGPKVDEKLKKNLDDGINELIVKIQSACTETVTGDTGTTTTTDETDVTESGSTGTTGTTDTEPDASTGTDTGKDKGNGKDKATKPEPKPTPTPKPEPTTPEPTTPEPVTPTTPPDTGGVGPGT